jgi:hypothetical protein
MVALDRPNQTLLQEILRDGLAAEPPAQESQKLRLLFEEPPDRQLRLADGGRGLPSVDSIGSILPILGASVHLFIHCVTTILLEHKSSSDA